MRTPLRLVRVDDPRPALELVRSDGTGWFVAPLPPRARLRLRYSSWPRPELRLEDTPRPRCPECRGTGGWERDYGHPDTGEYDGTEFLACTCWDPYRGPVLIIPLPRRIARRLGAREPAASTEPPF